MRRGCGWSPAYVCAKRAVLPESNASRTGNLNRISRFYDAKLRDRLTVLTVRLTRLLIFRNTNWDAPEGTTTPSCHMSRNDSRYGHTITMAPHLMSYDVDAHPRDGKVYEVNVLTCITADRANTAASACQRSLAFRVMKTSFRFQHRPTRSRYGFEAT